MRTTSTGGTPAFVVDPASVSRNSGRQVDWALVAENRRLTPGQIVTTTGIAAIAAISIPVVALTVAIPSGTTLDFTGAGEFAKLTAAAAIGATALTVEALDAQIESGDTAVFAGTGKKFLAGGTVVSESVVGNVRKIIPRVGSSAATGILITDANEDSTVEAKSGYGVYTGGKFYESLLPDAAGTPRVLDATIKAELVALPDGMSFESYTDSSAA